MKRNKIDIQPKKLTVFDIPSDEAKAYLSAIIKDVNTIISNPKFIQATKKATLPDNPTIADIEAIVTRVAPAKIYAFLSLFIFYKNCICNFYKCYYQQIYIWI